MIESYTDLLLSRRYAMTALLMLVVWAVRLVVLTGLISGLLVRCTIWLSHHYDVMARPSDRGSHTVPTPRLGGIGSAAAVFISVFLMAWWGISPPLQPWMLVFLIGGAWALIGGALDDFQELGPRWKLLVQIAACWSCFMFVFAPTTFDLPFAPGIVIPQAAGVIVAVLVTFFMMNIFNFMDGMDGQAAVFGIVTAFGLALHLGNHGFSLGFGLRWHSMYLAGMAAVVAGSLIGLLAYNFPGRSIRTKTFMGDCGSQYYGFVLSAIALQAGEGPPQERFPWIASFILFSPFIYDVCFTLIRRWRRGDRLTQAHRTHLYQRLMVAGWTHGETLRLNLVLYVIMLLLSWGYAAAAMHGFVQVLILILSAGVLASYTLFVMSIERQAESRRISLENSRDSSS